MITCTQQNQWRDKGRTSVKQQNYCPEDFTASASMAQYAEGDFVKTSTQMFTKPVHLVFIMGVGPTYSPTQASRRSKKLSNELNNLYEECSMPNWDGYGAKPAYKSIRKTVEKFLDALPANIADPEIGADPDGEISLDWCHARNKMFAISIGRKNRIAYAILDGDKRSNGIEIFKGDLPSSIIYHLENFFGNQA